MAYESLNPRVVNDMKQGSWRVRADGQNRMTNDCGTCHFDCQVLIVCTNMREMLQLMFHIRLGDQGSLCPGPCSTGADT